MQISRRLGSVISILLVVALVQIASANIVIQHSGDADPVTEGFTTGAPLAGSPTISGGVPAWNIRDDDSNAGEIGGDARYSRPGSSPVNNLFTNDQEAAFLAKGWVASYNIEVVSGSLFQGARGVEAGFTVEVAGVDHRYSIRWGRKDPAGINPTGSDLEIRFETRDPLNNPVYNDFTFSGKGSGFHRLDLVAAPGSFTTSIYLDGVLVPFAYGGFEDGINFVFGSFIGDQDANQVYESNWNLAQFAVPEPASAGLLALAGAAALGLRRNRR